MLDGFKAFLTRGNVVDLAVGVIMGIAFGAVVDALVKGLIDPVLGAVIGKPQFDLMIGPANLGLLITALVNFVIKAAAVYFFVVLPLTSYAAKLAPPAPGPTPTETTLVEIRDLLKKGAR